MQIKRLVFPQNRFSGSSTSGTIASSTPKTKVNFGSKYNFSNKFKFKLPKFKIPWKFLIIFFGILSVLIIAFAVLAYFFIAKPLMNIADEAKKVKDSTYTLNQGVKNMDLVEVKTGLENTRTQLDSFKKSVDINVTYIRKLPKAEIYLTDLDHVLTAANEAINLGELTVNIIEPYSTDLGFAVGGKEATNIPAQERIIKLMRLMPEFSPKVNEISAGVKKINDELNQIDPKNYPTELPSYVSYLKIDPKLNLRSQITDIQSITKDLSEKAPQFEAFFNAFPEFMGLNAPKRYMMLLANNYELRMSGGFNTYLVIVELKEGIPEIVYSIDTYFIDEGDRAGSFARVVRQVPYHLRNYLYLPGNTFRWYARDATSNSPDFQYAADDFLNIFWKPDRSLPQKIDGVMQINNDVAVDLLTAVGAVNTSKYSIRRDDGSYVTVPVTEFNGDNVILELENIAGGKLAQTIGRKEIIKFLGQSIFTKIYNSEATNLVHIVRVMLDSLSKKDVLIYTFDPKVQKAFDDLGYSGKVAKEPVNADYLHVNRSNYGAGKADWSKPGFVTQSVDKNVEIIDGKKISTVKVTIKNPKRPEWYNIDPCCFYNSYMRVYVPAGSKMISVTSSDGEDVKGAEFMDDRIGKPYIESFSRQKKETELTITYVYQLPDNIDLDNYKILVQRQSGSSQDDYRIGVNGLSKDVIMNSDKLLDFSKN